MRKDCSTCKHDYMETEYPLREPCNTCIASSRGGAPSRWEASEHYRPDTNADRIRAMTDEELARFLKWNVPDCVNFCDDARCGCKWNCKHSDGLIIIRNWLQQPVKED